MQSNIWKFQKKTEEYNEQPANILSSLQRDFGVFGDDDDLLVALQPIYFRVSSWEALLAHLGQLAFR